MGKIEPLAGRSDESDEPGIRSELLEGLVGYRLRRANGAVMTDFMASLGDLGMRPVLFALIAMIRDNPGINQTTLGRSLGIQRANLVPLVNELTTRHLVERRAHPTDRRAFALYLNKTGEAMFAEAVERIRAHEERMLSRLDEGERRKLFELLNKLRAD
ncbi:MAG: MarR family winged helix-turn-helix transcriptional regulator [Allosphingosinicella sp.]